ncbi:hypothetical protein CDD82_4763 [Ophiocordyceps australis]|uniref:mannan endo-1,6-alpha-mannosidase n=1 Tax=Ophiocordyceps australis TaxID=1399860 RepID=A0A2C5Z470_9HYPO|nr:hypothetical protein CDD82_4763 [Ophiocordyceps australis]
MNLRGGQVAACVAAALLSACPWTQAYKLDPDSVDSIKTIAKSMADDMLSYYDGDKPGGTPGLLPQPYYWWEAGAMMGALIDYWYYTKDDSYNNLTIEGLLWQVGETDDYMPRNQTLTEGNDDQGFWGLSVMSAAEYNFPNPPPDKPQWLGLAQAVFNTQAARWDTEHCSGGLRWQIFKWNEGFDYKNSISQACFFALGARLALYTGNHSYAEWAERTWDWMIDVKFIDEYWRVLDGAHTPTNCTDIIPYQFSYNSGGFILGAAAMYNYTEEQRWKDRLDKLLEGNKVFFTGPQKNIMTEVACEPVNRCNLDQQSFKAYLSRWLAAATKWAPHTYKKIMPYLRASAVAAAKQCVGGHNGRMCGLKWNQDKYDGSSGVGQQMAAMEVTLACMIKDRSAPVTQNTGGTSEGKPGGGGADIGRTEPRGPFFKPITDGDKAGAIILTVLVLGGFITGIFWILFDELSEKRPLDHVKGLGGLALAAQGALASAGRYVMLLAASTLRPKEKKEKGGAKISAVGEGDANVGSGEKMQKVEELPVKIGAVRSHSGDSRPRPLSNMPRGWPNNPSLRPSPSLKTSQHRQSSSSSSSSWGLEAPRRIDSRATQSTSPGSLSSIRER